MSVVPAKPLSAAMQRVAQVLQDAGHPHAPLMLADAARTAQQAADALGVKLGQIAKSIVFKRVHDERAVLVITSGDLRVDETKVSHHVALPDGSGGELARADADFVKLQTGFSIGGVSPIAHAQPCVVLVDQALFRFKEIWAAAGHPHGVFCLSPQQLLSLTGAPAVDVTVDKETMAA